MVRLSIRTAITIRHYLKSIDEPLFHSGMKAARTSTMIAQPYVMAMVEELAASDEKPAQIGTLTIATSSVGPRVWRPCCQLRSQSEYHSMEEWVLGLVQIQAC